MIERLEKEIKKIFDEPVKRESVPASLFSILKDHAYARKYDFDIDSRLNSINLINTSVVDLKKIEDVVRYFMQAMQSKRSPEDMENREFLRDLLSFIVKIMKYRKELGYEDEMVENDVVKDLERITKNGEDDLMESVMDYLKEGGDETIAAKVILIENLEDELFSKSGYDKSVMKMLVLMDMLFDRNSLYYYNGWEQGEIVETDVNDLWFTAIIRLPSFIDVKSLKFLKHVISPGRVFIKKEDDSNLMVKIDIPRRKLDEQERELKKSIDKIIEDEMDNRDVSVVAGDMN